MVLTVVALELLFALWPFALPFFHQSDKFLEAQIEKEYQVLQPQSPKTKSSYSGLFNPNFIGFLRAIHWGMSVEEIEHIERLRASNQWISPVSDFQKVSGISDRLLSEIEPYFKLPKWVGESRKKYQFTQVHFEVRFKYSIGGSTQTGQWHWFCVVQKNLALQRGL